MTEEIKIPKVLRMYLDEYCMRCGAKLVLKGKRLEQYSHETGEPEYLYKIGCPKANWLTDWPTLFSFKLPAFHTQREYLVCAPSPTFKGHQTVLERMSY